MSLRSEFLAFARSPGANLSELCRRYEISRKTGYKWLRRTELDREDVQDRSPRPHSSPRCTEPGVEAHVLAVLDDHSRFCICLAACLDEQANTVRQQLTSAFQRYGLPERMLTDNGPPWGASGQGLHTRLTAWLIRLGVTVSHGRPLHPQTQGKDERFHRSLKLELLSQRPVWHSNPEVQSAFDGYRPEYNFERPHEALSYEVPASRYAPSPRAFPTVLPVIDYDSDFQIRKVKENGSIKLQSRYFFVSRAFAGDPVGLRQVGEAVWNVYYCHQRVAQIDLNVLPTEGDL